MQQPIYPGEPAAFIAIANRPLKDVPLVTENVPDAACGRADSLFVPSALGRLRVRGTSFKRRCWSGTGWERYRAGHS